jgi:hypothetical protein
LLHEKGLGLPIAYGQRNTLSSWNEYSFVDHTAARGMKMASVNIIASVGFAGTNNEKDAVAVKQRLVDLGFSWLASNGEVDPKVGPETIRAIQLFQAIKNGFDILANLKNDGLIEPQGDAHLWLRAANAPRWLRLPAGSANEGCGL